jgi:hypothetical protein
LPLAGKRLVGVGRAGRRGVAHRSTFLKRGISDTAVPGRFDAITVVSPAFG